MTTQAAFDFRWLSPLGISVSPFLFYGPFHIFISALMPIMADKETSK